MEKRNNQNNKYSQHGFTLVEVLVASMLSLVIIGVATTILLTTTNLFTSSAHMRNDKLICDGVISYLEECVQSASYLEITDKAGYDRIKENNSAIQYITISGAGYLETNGELIFFGKAYYGDATLSFNITEEGNYAIKVILYLYDAAGNIRASKSYILRAFAMELAKRSIIFSQDTIQETSYICFQTKN